MLAGISHDMRTILTRFKLELAFLGDGQKVQPLKADVDEMQRMLEVYMAFVKGDAGEAAQEVDFTALIHGASRRLQMDGDSRELDIPADQKVKVKPNAFSRLLTTLIGNAARNTGNDWVHARVSDQISDIDHR